MLIRSLTFGLAALALAGCGNEAEPNADQPSPATVTGNARTVEDGVAVRDVQFFIDNPDERRTVREQCRNNPGALEITQDCVNADKANSEARRRSTREKLGG